MLFTGGFMNFLYGWPRKWFLLAGVGSVKLTAAKFLFSWFRPPPPVGLSGGYNQDSRISDVHPAPKRTKRRLLWVCGLGIRTASGWGAWVLREEAEIWNLSFHWKQVVCSAVLGVLGWVGRLLGWGLPPAPTPQHRGLLTRCPAAHLGCKQPAAERRFKSYLRSTELYRRRGKQAVESGWEPNPTFFFVCLLTIGIYDEVWPLPPTKCFYMR